MLPDILDCLTIRTSIQCASGSACELQNYSKIEFKGGLPPSFLKMQISCWQICYWSDVFCEKFAGKLLVFFGMLVQRASLEYGNFSASFLRHILSFLSVPNNVRVTVCECPQVCLCVYIRERKGTFRVEHWVKGPFFPLPHFSSFPLLLSVTCSLFLHPPPSPPYSVWIRGSMDVNAMFFSVFSMKIPLEQLFL